MAVPKSTTTQALDALLKWKNTQSDSQKPQLLPQDDFIYLILTLKKIPQKGGVNGARTNPYRIPLPHPLLPPSSSPELCLIIDDRPNSNLTSEIAKKKIKAEEIPVNKVLKLSKLKTDYKPFEAKRKLCDSYEMFFADRRVIPLLPKLLGKQFFKKKKLPLPVDLGHKNWKEQIERGCGSGLFFLKTGTCSVIRVAKSSMERDEIVENVCAAIDGVVGFVPKKLAGIRSLHLKLSESVALPLYQALPDIKLRIEGIKEKIEEVGGGEVVVRDGDTGKKKQRAKKGRIHEVNHDGDKDELGSENEDGKIENLDLGNAELVGKKRKGESNEKKPAKRSGKEKSGAKDGGSLGKKKRANKGENIDNDDLGIAALVVRREGESNEEKTAKRSGKETTGPKDDDGFGKKKRVKKHKGDGQEFGSDNDGDDNEGGNDQNDDLGSVKLVGRKRKGEPKDAKPAKESGKQKSGTKGDGGFGKKKRNEDEEEDEKKDLDTKNNMKRVKKQKADEGKKKGKKKGSSVSRV